MLKSTFSELQLCRYLRSFSRFCLPYLVSEISRKFEHSL